MEPLTRDGRVLTCVISVADRGNTLSSEAMSALCAALAEPDASLGCVLLVGAGSSFCTGGDVGGFATAADPSAHVGALAAEFHAFLLALAETPVPVIAAVHGWAAGAGMSIVCASDLAVAGESAKLRAAYPGLGFSPDGGMSWTLPRLVGSGRARRILLTNEVLDAPTALALGVLSHVVADAEVAAVAGALAHDLADGPTTALGRIKTLLRESPGRSLPDQLDAEALSIAACAGGPEGREGVAAFAERRRPRWR